MDITWAAGGVHYCVKNGRAAMVIAIVTRSGAIGAIWPFATTLTVRNVRITRRVRRQLGVRASLYRSTPRLRAPRAP